MVLTTNAGCHGRINLARAVYLRHGPCGESFDSQLSAEVRTELLEIPSAQVYCLRESPPTYQSGPPLRPEVVLRPPPPVLPPRPPVTPGAVRPAQRASRWSGPGIWLLLGFLVGIGLLPHAISTLRAPSSVSVYGTQPGSQQVEVRRALPPPPLEVRRALPAVPRALPVNLCGVKSFQCTVAAGKHARRHHGAGFLSGRVAEQCSAAEARAVHRRRVVDRQHKLDLDEAGGSEFCFMG
jgi:hypothetical protein